MKAIITTAAAWIVMVNTMSDRPQRQLGLPNISIDRSPQKSVAAASSRIAALGEAGVPLTELLPLMFQDSSGHESAGLYRENLQIRGWERERFAESELNGALAKTTSTNVAVELCRGLGHQRSDAT